MPSYCAAPGCSHRGGRSMRMYSFPRDPVRRRKWHLNCRRGSWTPTNTSRLCQAHFEVSQFERNVPNKLKPNAIPTIFSVPNPPIKIYDAEEMAAMIRAKDFQKEQAARGYEHNYAANQKKESQEKNKANAEFPEYLKKGDHAECWNEITKLRLENVKLQRQMLMLDQTLRQMETSLGAFLNPEQIQMLKCKTKRKNCVWSANTIKRAFQLRCAVGIRGYLFLVSEGYPLPSYSSLCYRMKTLKFDQEVTSDVYHILGKGRNLNPTEKDCVLTLCEDN
ncbi:PREDICTED: THAP domain-containing protein 5-like [Priapulus caudatus]|uniref:THAP domain-containing protein 5-like n=1 Tax=Priapulus caudatus TaxID=37621 RepID=A0ABM1DUZ8_PRICU|nr:PREDICTED: THAP domain-containing protein 5-like [Priapulus caudatus]XP_014663770.1 PREDICTED: THAP domain-containing protein 5-like [Priapulus caudatus]XP_014663771.1 PREDICTED: THAP domain-containing protein 5-like [Priapulus caudatus]XP_014663772.1 PREDICTED: THAP domain-containing protein 5-like [Priapulus caudatus]